MFLNNRICQKYAPFLHLLHSIPHNIIDVSTSNCQHLLCFLSNTIHMLFDCSLFRQKTYDCSIRRFFIHLYMSHRPFPHFIDILTPSRYTPYLSLDKDSKGFWQRTSCSLYHRPSSFWANRRRWGLICSGVHCNTLTYFTLRIALPSHTSANKQLVKKSAVRLLGRRSSPNNDLDDHLYVFLGFTKKLLAPVNS